MHTDHADLFGVSIVIWYEIDMCVWDTSEYRIWYETPAYTKQWNECLSERNRKRSAYFNEAVGVVMVLKTILPVKMIAQFISRDIQQNQNYNHQNDSNFCMLTKYFNPKNACKVMLNPWSTQCAILSCLYGIHIKSSRASDAHIRQCEISPWLC